MVVAASTSAAANDKDCSDFATQRAAQHWFHKHHPHRDPSRLDADHDGIACESNPCPCDHHPYKVAEESNVAVRAGGG